MKMYDTKQYEERLCYYNVFQRYQHHDEYFDVDEMKYLPDTCGDCLLEYFAISEYLKMKKSDFTIEQIYKEIRKGLLI